MMGSPGAFWKAPISGLSPNLPSKNICERNSGIYTSKKFSPSPIMPWFR